MATRPGWPSGEVRILEGLPLQPDAEDVVRLLSRRSAAGPTPRREAFLARVRQAQAEALSLAAPAVLCGVWAREDLPKGLAPFEAPFTAFGVVTVGGRLEAGAAEGGSTPGLAHRTLLNAWASQLVESLAQAADTHLRGALRPWPGGPRVSPGYGRWSLEAQRGLFALLSAHRIGVNLTEACLMQPVKSISFAIPFGPEWEGLEAPAPSDKCLACGLETCDMRRCADG